MDVPGRTGGKDCRAIKGKESGQRKTGCFFYAHGRRKEICSYSCPRPARE